jgi:hypothetical protein
MLPVKNLASSVKHDTVQLSWDKNQETDFGAYRIYRSVDNKQSFKLYSYGIKSNNFTDTDLENGRTYFYVVSAVDTLMGMESLYNDTVRALVNTRVLNQYKFDFNKLGNTESWTGNQEVNGLVQTTSLNGSDGVLKSASGISGNNPLLTFQGNLTLNHSTDSWATIEIRLRQIGTDGKTPQTFDSQGTSCIIQYLNSLNLGELKLPKWSIKPEVSTNWMIATADISGINTNNISGLSINPIGNSTGLGKNFELDYVYLKKNAPMPVPTNLSAIIANGMVKLTWNKIQDKDIKSYRIYRTPMVNSTNQLLAVVSDSTFIDLGSTDGLTYTYSVSSIDSLGNESVKSSEVKIQSKNKAQMACYQFEFNTSGTTEGWTANPNTNTLTQATSINGADRVVKSLNGISGIDPMMFYNYVLNLPTAGSKWVSLELRARQLNAAQTGSQIWDPSGTIALFDSPDRWNSNEIKTPNFVITTEITSNWINAKLDISRIGSSPITSIRLDFIGNSAGIGKNYELDYVRLFCTPFDIIPPAAPISFKAVAGDTRIKLSWNTNIESDLLDYNLYRSNQTGRPPSLYKPGIKFCEFTDSLLIYGINYLYQLAAVDSSGNESARTAIISATPGFSHTMNPASGSHSLTQKVYPNPFMDETTIEYLLDQPENIKLEIFNISGQKVAEEIHTNQWSGTNSFTWNGKTNSGKLVTPGVYFCRLSSNHVANIIRLIKQ